MPEPLQVTAAEAGQKLLQFLSRRFEEPQSVLHRHPFQFGGAFAEKGAAGRGKDQATGWN